MNATQELSVNCENGAGEEEIKPPLFAPSFSEDTACLGVSIGNVSYGYASLQFAEIAALPAELTFFMPQVSELYLVAQEVSALVPSWQARWQPSTASRGLQLLRVVWL